MRVISGFLGGRKFAAPKGLNTRPTSDRVKESLFNILGNTPHNKDVLDLFAGSGSLGIEALSRYANYCAFVDEDHNSIKTITQNINDLNLSSNCTIHHMTWQRAIELFAQKKQTFDLVFLDPPYCKDLVNNAMISLKNYGILRKDVLIVAEHSRKDELKVTDNFTMFKQRNYGDTVLSFFTLKES